MNKVVVSRQWHKPIINVFIDAKEIGSEIELDDFLLAMLDVVGKPTYMFTREQLKKAVFAAKEQIIQELKKATVHA
jgi:hypothetical protein